TTDCRAGPLGRPSRLRINDPGRGVRVVRRLARQIDAEGGSAVGSRRLEDQVAAHRQAQLTRDVQSEPAAIIGGPIRSALEPPEEPASVGLRDPRTMAGDRYPEAVCPRR